MSRVVRRFLHFEDRRAGHASPGRYGSTENVQHESSAVCVGRLRSCDGALRRDGWRLTFVQKALVLEGAEKFFRGGEAASNIWRRHREQWWKRRDVLRSSSSSCV